MLVELLRTLHEAHKPRVIMGLRLQDPLPEWVSHVALVLRGRVQTGTKALVLKEVQSQQKQKEALDILSHIINGSTREELGETLVEMTGLNVQYGERHVRPA